MKYSLILIAAMAAGPLCTAQNTAIEKAVLEADDRATAAGQDRSAARLLDFMLDNDKGSVAMNGSLLLTREDTRKSVAASFRAMSSVEYRWKRRLVTVLSPEIAVVVSEGESAVTTTQGASFTAPFVQTAVWVLRDGAWKILHAHQSSPRR